MDARLPVPRTPLRAAAPAAGGGFPFLEVAPFSQHPGNYLAASARAKCSSLSEHIFEFLRQAAAGEVMVRKWFPTGPKDTSACTVDPRPAPSAPARDRFSVGAVTPPTQREARRAVHDSLGVPRVVLLACSGLPIMSQARSASRARARPGAMARPPTALRRSLARAFLRPSRVLRRSARARTPTRTHPPSPSLKPCAVGPSALRRPAAQGGAGRGQLSFTDLGTPLHPPRPELEALPSWM